MWKEAPQALKQYSRRYVARQMLRTCQALQKLPKKERDKIWKTAKGLVSVIPRNISIEKRVTLLYYTITSQVTYDLHCGSSDKNSILPYIFPTPLCRRRGVCMSIAELITLLCMLMDIKAVTVVGYGATSREDAEENGVLHAWNMVRLDDGRYYHLDATWDLHKPDPNWEPHWLFKSDSEMVHHYWITEDYPKARKSFPGKPYFPQKGVDLLSKHWGDLIKK